MNPQSSIKVKLLSNGKYTWELIVLLSDVEETVGMAKKLDSKLREEFPDHVQKSWAKAVEMD